MQPCQGSWDGSSVLKKDKMAVEIVWFFARTKAAVNDTRPPPLWRYRRRGHCFLMAFQKVTQGSICKWRAAALTFPPWPSAHCFVFPLWWFSLPQEEGLGGWSLYGSLCTRIIHEGEKGVIFPDAHATSETEALILPAPPSAWGRLEMSATSH